MLLYCIKKLGYLGHLYGYELPMFVGLAGGKWGKENGWVGDWFLDELYRGVDMSFVRIPLCFLFWFSILVFVSGAVPFFSRIYIYGMEDFFFFFLALE